MAYETSNPGKPNTIVLRDMSTGTEHLLDDKGPAATGVSSRDIDLSGRIKSDL